MRLYSLQLETWYRIIWPLYDKTACHIRAISHTDVIALIDSQRALLEVNSSHRNLAADWTTSNPCQYDVFWPHKMKTRQLWILILLRLNINVVTFNSLLFSLFGFCLEFKECSHKMAANQSPSFNHVCIILRTCFTSSLKKHKRKRWLVVCIIWIWKLVGYLTWQFKQI